MNGSVNLFHLLITFCISLLLSPSIIASISEKELELSNKKKINGLFERIEEHDLMDTPPGKACE